MGRIHQINATGIKYFLISRVLINRAALINQLKNKNKMRKTFKAIFMILLFLVIFPAVAALVVMILWNNIIPAACGFATITFWQACGLFILGQILTGGIVLAMFLAAGGIHAMGHHHGEWKNHWHKMTDAERLEFIERRRREHFGFLRYQNKSENEPK